jgi:Peptidase_C39 like family
MKKSNIAYLLILSLFLIPINVSATTENVSIMSLNNSGVISDESSVVFDQLEANYYTNIGLMPSKSTRAACYYVGATYICETESISISGMTTYYQNGQSWSSQILNGCTDSIGNSGCAVTSFAIISSKYGSKDDPGQVNSKLGVLACPFNYSGAATSYGLKYSNIVSPGTYTLDSVKATLLGVLRVGRPVMLVIKNSTTTHFVVVSGYKSFSDGSFYFYIKDPSYPGKATVNSYMSSSYSIRLAYVFYK